MKRRGVVTGVGTVSPLGLNTVIHWQNVSAGKSAVRRITFFDPSNFPIKVIANIQNFPFDEESDLSRTQQMLLMASQEAADQACLQPLQTAPKQSRYGVYCALTSDWPQMSRLLRAHDDPPIWRHRVPATMNSFAQRQIGITGSLLADWLGISGGLRATRVLDGACASGSETVGEAFRHVREGKVDIAIATGACCWIDVIGMIIYKTLGTLTTEENPDEASCPFNLHRKGFVLAEGAGALILEDLQHALRRGAQPLAEITGYGSSTSACRATDMPEDGAPLCRGMALALNDAGRSSEEVDYVNAHGTGTRQNDAVETLALRQVFGKRAWDVPISSNKSMIGHTITAAGVMEAVTTVMTVQEDLIPPTINLRHPDPDCDLDYVPLVARKQKVHVAMSNSFGFGGLNSTVIIEKFESTRRKA